MKQFWKVWGELDVKLPEHSNFRLFKQGVRPSVEDPANASGGKIIIRWPLRAARALPRATRFLMDRDLAGCYRSKKADTSRLWFELILVVITQQLSPAEAINGIVLSIGHRENMVAVWVRSEFDEDRPFIQDVFESLRGLLGLKPTARIVHQHHRQTARAASPRDGADGAGFAGRSTSQSLPHTPDYSSDEDEDGGALRGMRGGGVQPDALTEKLIELASARGGRTSPGR